MKDRAYRDAYVRSQITTALPFQLRALRKARGWTQEQLAELSGMAQSRFPSLEKPTGKMPDLDTLCRIAAVYDIALQVRFLPFSELIDWDEGFDPDAFNIGTFDGEFGESSQPIGDQNPKDLLHEIVEVQQYQVQQVPNQTLMGLIESPWKQGKVLPFPGRVGPSAAAHQVPSGQPSRAQPIPPQGELLEQQGSITYGSR